MNYFEELSAVDCSEHIERKGRFSYLSWPFAVAELRKRHPDSFWTVIKSNGMPYMQTEAGCFVEVSVTVNGVSLSQVHPVLDNNNRSIEKPNAFQINTSIQRCLVKAIALHGLGLYIYAGEDLPETPAAPVVTPRGGIGDDLPDDEKQSLADSAAYVADLIQSGEVAQAKTFLTDQNLEPDQKVWLFNQLPSNVRSALKKG